MLRRRPTVGSGGASFVVWRYSATSTVASEQSGRASLLTTLDTYSHAIPAVQEEAAGLVFAGK